MVAPSESGSATFEPRSVRVSLPTPFPMADVAEFIVRPDIVGSWLMEGAHLPARGEAIIPGAIGPLSAAKWDYVRTGVVEKRDWDRGERRLVISAGVSPEFPRTVTFQVTARPNGSYVRITERGLADERDIEHALWVWQGALNRLDKLLRRDLRQALIVVHGIGEQIPGQTLREFTTAIFPRSGDAQPAAEDQTYVEPHYVSYVKPDYASKLFEMRIVSVRGDRAAGRPTTDVYELYWAHLIRDTTVGQVYSWALRLLLAKQRDLPKNLTPHVWAIRVVILAAILAVPILTYTGVISQVAAWLAAGALAALPAILWFVFGVVQKKYFVDFAGDAARYLEPRPGNIQVRQEIREAGLDLLNALHDGGRYDRIIVYGHSLGSVIAYDILSYAWTRRGRQRRSEGRVTSRRMLEVEDLLNPGPSRRSLRTGQPDGTVAQARARQQAAWQEYRANGFDWLVTDFVTAGSPLAHARWLLNLDKRASFDQLVEERTFPTCPPATEEARTPTKDRYRRSFTFTHTAVDSKTGRNRSVQVPHHGGLFAITRWSNLYFPASGLLRGDPVGGPLEETFGNWIDDHELKQPGHGISGFAHTYYVSPKNDKENIDTLRRALALDFGMRNLEPKTNDKVVSRGANSPRATTG